MKERPDEMGDGKQAETVERTWSSGAIMLVYLVVLASQTY